MTKHSSIFDSDLSTEKRLTRIEETIRALITLLSRETDAVKRIDLQGFNDLQLMKADLLDIYHTDVKTLLTKNGELKQLPEAAKNSIRTLERDLSIARVENMSTLERAGKSFARLRDRIVDVARSTALRSTAQYGSNGQLQMNIRKPISTGLHDRV